VSNHSLILGAPPKWQKSPYLEFAAQVATLPSLILALSPSGVTSSIRPTL